MNKQLKIESAKQLSFLSEISLPSYPLTLLSSFKRSAFTLAETLIVLAVIGVVAALTLPNIIINVQERIRVSQVNSAYTLLLNATKNLIEGEGSIDSLTKFPDRVRPTKFEELLPKYLNIVKVCGKLKTGCIAYSYTALDGSSVAGVTTANYTYRLKNGIGIKVNTETNSDCLQDMTLEKFLNNNVNKGTYATACYEILVDINGPAGPNKSGVDYFNFYVVQDGLVPGGSPKEDVWSHKFVDMCPKYGRQCTAWIILNKNMDYLHCPEKLGWSKARSCK